MDQCTQSVYTQINLQRHGLKTFSSPQLDCPEESSPIRILFPPQRRITKKQGSLAHSAHVRALECRKDGTSMKGRREAISVVISLLQ